MSRRGVSKPWQLQRFFFSQEFLSRGSTLRKIGGADYRHPISSFFTLCFILILSCQPLGPLGEHLHEAVQHLLAPVERQGFYLCQHCLIDKTHVAPPFPGSKRRHRMAEIIPYPCTHFITAGRKFVQQAGYGTPLRDCASLRSHRVSRYGVHRFRFMGA